MSIPRDHVRYIIFYEWRRGTGATVTVRNINSVWEEDTTSTAEIRLRFACFEEGDTEFGDKPWSGRPLAVDDSVILDTIKRIQKLTSAVLRRDLDVPDLQSSVAFKSSVTEKC